MSQPQFLPFIDESFLETINVSEIPLVKSPYSGSLFGSTKYASYACPSCLSSCKSAHEIKEGRFAGTTVRDPIILIYDAEKCGRLRLPHYGEAMKLMELMHRYGMCKFTSAQ